MIKPKGYTTIFTGPCSIHEDVHDGHCSECIELGETYPDLTMNEAEIKERLDLNIANTSESLRARVLQHQATTNGHDPISPQ